MQAALRNLGNNPKGEGGEEDFFVCGCRFSGILRELWTGHVTKLITLPSPPSLIIPPSPVTIPLRLPPIPYINIRIRNTHTYWRLPSAFLLPFSSLSRFPTLPALPRSYYLDPRIFKLLRACLDSLSTTFSYLLGSWDFLFSDNLERYDWSGTRKVLHIFISTTQSILQLHFHTTFNMFSTTSSSASTWRLVLVTVLATVQFATAHFQVVYPGWRGNTLKDDLQWNYPCESPPPPPFFPHSTFHNAPLVYSLLTGLGAGIATTNNRTNWPITGGDISIIPGWNAGHPTAFFYVNMGFGSQPPNMTNVMLPVFQMTGPSKNPYPGTFCLQQVPLPVNASVKVGDNATIQVIQVALHGASLYNVSLLGCGD